MIQHYVNWGIPLNSLGICLLLAGMTVCARMPRLARDKTCKALAVGVFALGCGAYVVLVEGDMRHSIGARFEGWRGALNSPGIVRESL